MPNEDPIVRLEELCVLNKLTKFQVNRTNFVLRSISKTEVCLCWNLKKWIFGTSSNAVEIGYRRITARHDFQPQFVHNGYILQGVIFAHYKSISHPLYTHPLPSLHLYHFNLFQDFNSLFLNSQPLSKFSIAYWISFMSLGENINLYHIKRYPYRLS